MSQKPLIVIVGPTAVGKTGLSVELALKINGEIISADSMQIYKYMDIGTAKATPKERKGVKHYLLDEITPDEEFSVARYKELADRYIDEIISKGKLPIMVGGTGLYVNAVTDNIKFSETICDWDYRNQLQILAETNGNEYLHKMLEEVDPVTAQRLHTNDTRRIIRALEVYKYTGIPISRHQEESRKEPSPYKLAMIGLTMDREWLYQRINERVEIMIEQGLVNEVQKLLDMGYNKEMTSMKGLGYKEIIDYLNGETTFEQAIDILKRDTRRYAKRQLTWFRRDKRIHWIHIHKEDSKKELIEKCLKYIAEIGIM
ncbi:MAG: tRNA dimethylallyltransferase [Petroclostridium sp.]|jgi:tRNA dimethylallyltransferase|uniref:tRNA (adenosine(37)-N6)-dimethylallyltransferase MiaA n=1 Tax=Petroclostridium xylanilyticum TaxID=1792311 RepID=UPI000B98BE70|nr:tRNA (adenosine(37)-N6)-dimethylallyltransferase MiaA [Petroclostridium xylanilyticum]MBZ4646549.1 tRNA delta(2)-isopentenylpyrophosphate transferase [Clostridia bacterium]MDK2810628.1 tRNA dimethylallyltransferase [Petroclostridium sp.]